MNSYGESWADKGYGYISYSIAESVILEAYVLKPNPPFYRIDLPSVNKGTRYGPVGHDAPRTVDVPIADLIPKDAQLRIDSISPTDAKLSIPVSVSSYNQGFFWGDKSTKVYIRLFTVTPDGKVRPLMSKDSVNRLSNGQTAFKSAVKVDPKTYAYVFSVQIPYQKLNIRKETGKKEPRSEQYVSTKLRAEAVFYQGQEAVAVSKPVDFEVKY